MARRSRKQQSVVRETVAAYRVDTHGHAASLAVSATEAKNRFGPLLESAMRGHPVLITRHDVPKAVLLSIAEFESLVRAAEPNLESLSREFDTLLDQLQSKGSRNALKRAFDAAPAELGRLAVAHARRRG